MFVFTVGHGLRVELLTHFKKDFSAVLYIVVTYSRVCTITPRLC